MSAAAVPIPLAPLVPVALGPDDQPSPVVFDLPDALELPSLVAELRRLGAGKTSIRWLAPAGPRLERTEETTRLLLRVESPPFHSLLRAVPRAYAEQSPRVWVEIGWRLPLAEHLKPPADQIILVHGSGERECLADRPYQSGPATFLLPERSALVDADGDLRLPVPVRLIAGRPDGMPELWVLHDRPFEQLQRLAEQSDNRLLGRLSVAVGTGVGRRIVVLRANRGRGGPPVLILDALPCQPYLRLPNLYLPVGTQLRPPLRRDAVRQLFASDSNSVVWLEPGGSGTFAVHTLPGNPFRPLPEIITYIQAHEARALPPRIVDEPFALPRFIVDN